MTRKIGPKHNPFSQEELHALKQCIYQDSTQVFKIDAKAVERVSTTFNRSFFTCRTKAYQLKTELSTEFLNKQSTTVIEVLDIDLIELLGKYKKGKA